MQRGPSQATPVEERRDLSARPVRKKARALADRVEERSGDDCQGARLVKSRSQSPDREHDDQKEERD
jgi:hypothetical protein